MVRSINCVVLLLCLIQSLWGCVIPFLNFRIYHVGFDVSLTHEDGISEFVFYIRHNCRRSLSWSGDLNQYNGTKIWTFLASDVKLNLGDTLDCFIALRKNTQSYFKKFHYTVFNIRGDIPTIQPGTTVLMLSIEYIIPEPYFETHRKGFEISIPHQAGIEHCSFTDISNTEKNSTWSNATAQYGANKRWTYKNFNADLKIGDTLHYRIFVIKNRCLYIKTVQHSVSKFYEESSTSESGTSDLQQMSQHEMPRPHFIIYREGFEVSIPHEDGMDYFSINAYRNAEVWNIWAGAVNQYDKNGRWIYRNTDAELKLGDTLVCRIAVRKHGRICLIELRYIIDKIYERTTTNEPGTSIVKETPQYEIPHPVIKAYGRGFEVFVPHEEGIQHFSLHANRNSENSFMYSGLITQYDANERWTYKNMNTQLKLGDTLRCFITVTKNGLIYTRNVRHNITKIYEGTITNENEAYQYEIPKPRFVIYPDRFEVSIPHHEGIEYFALIAHRNSEITPAGWGHISQYDVNDRWTYENNDTQLNLGDTLRCFLFVSRNTVIYTKEVRHNISEIYDTTMTKENRTAGLNETSQYVIPSPRFFIYTEGFEVSIPHAEGIEYVAFTANRDAEAEPLCRKIWSAVITQSDAQGRWTFRNWDAKLHLGDTLNYWILMKKDGNVLDYAWRYTVQNYTAL